MKNHLEEGTGNLTGAEVVFDEDIPFYSAKIPSGGYLHIHKKRIIAFKNPDLILILRFPYPMLPKVVELVTIKDFQQKHEKTLEEISSEGGFTYKDGLRVLNLQKLVNREEEIFERVMANYQPILEDSTK